MRSYWTGRLMTKPVFLLYFIQVDAKGLYQVSTDLDKVEYNGNVKRRVVFISSTNYPIQVQYSKDTELKLIGIYFKHSLLRKFLKKDVFHYLKEYSQSRLKNSEQKSHCEGGGYFAA